MKLFHKLNGKWTEISGTSDGGGTKNSTVIVGKTSQKIIIPEGGTYNVNPENTVVCSTVPKSLSTRVQYSIDSPFGNIVCQALILVKKANYDKWMKIDSLYDSNGQYNIGINCPGDGKVYISIGNIFAWNANGATTPNDGTSGNITKIEDWAIILMAPSSESTLNEYSTDEKIVGVWIDGKPIYQRSFVTTTTNGLKLVDTGDIEELINQFGSFEYSSTYKRLCFPRLYSSKYATVYVSGDNNLVIESAGDYANKNCKITVQYTKITDSAN